MHLMPKVGGPADVHQRAPEADIVEPGVLRGAVFEEEIPCDGRGGDHQTQSPELHLLEEADVLQREALPGRRILLKEKNNVLIYLGLREREECTSCWQIHNHLSSSTSHNLRVQDQLRSLSRCTPTYPSRTTPPPPRLASPPPSSSSPSPSLSNSRSPFTAIHEFEMSFRDEDDDDEACGLAGGGVGAGRGDLNNDENDDLAVREEEDIGCLRLVLHATSKQKKSPDKCGGGEGNNRCENNR